MQNFQAVGKRANIFYEYRPARWLMPLERPGLGAILIAMTQAAAGSLPDLWLVCDRESARLNRRFLGCPGPTNIISFPDEDSPALFLSVDTYLREAMLFQQGKLSYLIRLLAHGFGHLAGLDHGPEMASIEEQAQKCAWLSLARDRQKV